MSFLITKQGYENIKNELQHLLNVERPRTLELLSNSRVIGDAQLEDSEYIFARDEQDKVENRISYLSNLLDNAKPIELKEHYNNVEFGATITLLDCDTNIKTKYTIVSSFESNPSNGYISIEAPIIKELLGASVGDIAEFNDKEYELIEIH